MTTARKFLLSLLVASGASLQAQPAVYKISDLLKRVSNDDTLYVVNFWATWCKPCVKELPAFDSLQHNFTDSNVKVLLVSLDFLEDLEKRLIPFLRDRKIISECILLDESNGNSFIDLVSPDWSGAIPATWFVKGHKKIFAERSFNLNELGNELSDLQHNK